MIMEGVRKKLILDKVAVRFHDVCAQQLINLEKGNWAMAAHWAIRKDELLSMSSGCFGIRRDELIEASGFPIGKLDGYRAPAPRPLAR